MTTAQRNATQHNRSTQHTADCNTTQRNAMQHNRTTHYTQLIATQHNATQPAQHDKTPDRYEIDGPAGRSTKNSTEKFGQKTLQVYLFLFTIFFSVQINTRYWATGDYFLHVSTSESVVNLK